MNSQHRQVGNFRPKGFVSHFWDKVTLHIGDFTARGRCLKMLNNTVFKHFTEFQSTEVAWRLMTKRTLWLCILIRPNILYCICNLYIRTEHVETPSTNPSEEKYSIFLPLKHYHLRAWTSLNLFFTLLLWILVVYFDNLSQEFLSDVCLTFENVEYQCLAISWCQ